MITPKHATTNDCGANSDKHERKGAREDDLVVKADLGPPKNKGRKADDCQMSVQETWRGGGGVVPQEFEGKPTQKISCYIYGHIC